MSNIPNTPENPVFDRLWQEVRLHIRNEPDDSIGVAGPREGGKKFYSWVEKYLDSGLGQRYWGLDGQGGWTIDENRTSIMRFFKVLVSYFARSRRQERTLGRRRMDARSESLAIDEQEEQLEDEEDTESEDLGDNGLYPPTIDTSTQEDDAREEANPVRQDSSVSPNIPISLPSVRKYALEGAPSPPLNCLRQLGPTPQGVGRRLSAATSSDSPLLHKSDNDQTFETRLGYDKTVAFLFASRTISFQDFFDRFCEIWRKDTEETDVEEVEVKVAIAGVGEYQLSFGLDRDRSWLQIMKIAKESPDSSILVTVVFDQCASYCEWITTTK